MTRKVFLILSALSLVIIDIFAQTGQRDLTRINQMPDLPAPYEMRDWKTVAQQYDQFIFDRDKSGQYLPLIGLKSAGINYPSLQPILLRTYVGSPSANQAEAINIIPAVVGATLAGIDKSSQGGLNWVEKTRDFYNKANGQNVYLNGYSAVSGGDWWYDVMPNVFFYQLYSQYPTVPDFQTQAVTIADRWLAAVTAMGGSAAPWSKPNMDYRAWNLASNTGNADGVHEPEAAGAIAWILYQAYQRTGDKKYREGAEMCLEFLNTLSTNPVYELQLPYGVLTAARMNAEAGSNYDMDKLLSWCFDRGPLRGWGSIVGSWNGKAVSGLIGEANDGGNDYAFSMNGFQQAAALAPLMKYDKRYARAIAKWVLNVANASRFFYSAYLPEESQDDYTWSHTFDPQSVIAYEALKQNWQGKPLYGTGDAKRNSWAQTNLGLYGSSHVGYLGAIVTTTDVEGILRLDLNATDFSGGKKYPVYALFNPYTASKTVHLSLPAGNYDIYDAISETKVVLNVSGTFAITLDAGSVVLLTYLPAGTTTQEAHGKLYAGTDVIDHRYGYHFEPALRIKVLAAEDDQLEFNQQVSIHATVDNAVNAVSYTWYVDDALANTTTSGDFTWAAPAAEGQHKLVLKASADGMTVKDSIYLSVWEEVPEPPVINGFTQDKPYYISGDVARLVVNVAGVGQHKFRHTWQTDSGTPAPQDSLLQWTTPAQDGLYTVSCTVKNKFGLETTQQIDILVKGSGRGPAAAFAYYPLDGDVKDYSGNNRNAQQTGTQFVADQRGSARSASHFSSAADMIYLPNQSALNFQEAITLAFWVKLDAVNAETFILSHGSWEERWKVSITPNRKLRWTVKTSATTKDLDSSFPLALNTYYHFTAVYTGYAIELYLNGALDSFAALDGPMATTSKALTFGHKDQDDAIYFLTGTLDEVRIYDQALQPDEILILKSTWNSEVVTAVNPETPGLKVYPNPVRGHVIYVDGINATNSSVTLHDTMGRALPAEYNEVPAGMQITLAQQVSGTVILTINTGKAVVHRKIMVLN
jgi:hypothetical protein